MKCFLYASAFVATVVVMLIFTPNRTLTAETKAIAMASNEPVVVQFGLFSVLPRRALRLGGQIGVKVSTAETPRARRFAES